MVKRKVAQSQGQTAPNSKMVRYSADLSGGEKEKEKLWVTDSGTIIKVKLQNFMCHQNFIYEPIPRLNFLCGSNGSGKSAVLTAIVFALGGSARTSNRGNSNRGLIRTGQHQALVEIHLLNEGDMAYQPERYGKRIIVVRTISATGSGCYKLKNEEGRIVVDRKVKQELDKILSFFNIQVDNPIAILNQDTAKSFLFKCDPHKLYDFFMRATQLEDLLKEQNIAEEEKSVADEAWVEKNGHVPKLKEEREKWDKKLTLLRSFRERKEEISQKVNELLWSVVKRAQCLHVCSSMETEKRKKRVESCNEAIKKENIKQDQLRTNKMDAEKEIQEIAANIDGKKKEVEDAKRNWIKLKEDSKTVNGEVHKLKKQINKEEDDIRMLNGTIEERRKSSESSEVEKKRLEKEAEMKAIEERVIINQNKYNTSSAHVLNLKNSEDSKRSEIDELKSILTGTKNEIDKKNRNLNSIEKQQGNKLVCFGSEMPRLVELIQKNGNKFSKLPIGPIGASIELAPNAGQDQVKVIEVELKQILRSFIVDNFEDKNTLGRLQKQCKTNFPVITSQFTDSFHNIGQGKCKGTNFPTIFDLLVIKDPNVSNCLVDQKRIENILVVPSEDQAQEIFSRIEKVPSNCIYGIVHNGTQYYPAPNYRTYMMAKGDNSGSNILKPDVKELIFSLKREVQNLNQTLAGDKEQVSAATAMFNRLKSDREKEERLIRELREKLKADNTTLSNIKMDLNDKPTNIMIFEEERDQAQEKVETLNEKLRQAEETLNNKKEIINEAEKFYLSKRNSYEEDAHKGDPLNQLIEEYTRDIKICEDHKEHYKAKKEEYTNQLAEAKVKESTKMKELEKVTEQARVKSKTDTPMETNKSPDELQREIQSLRDSLKEREKIPETYNEVVERLETSDQRYTSARRQLKQLKNSLGGMEAMNQRRKQGFVELRLSFGRRVQQEFAFYLETRKYSGSLDFNHARRTLEITVSPEGERDEQQAKRSMKTLSGGEKSYSTISLILSLWSVMAPPFRILDEFDVFMDMVNRRTALNQIINYSGDKKRFQYIFLTPLNTDGLDLDEDISILRLEKNQ